MRKMVLIILSILGAAAIEALMIVGLGAIFPRIDLKLAMLISAPFAMAALRIVGAQVGIFEGRPQNRAPFS
jgi:hypothetical protein